LYNDNVKVLDIHGHVSAPGGNGAQLLGSMLASNTPTRLDPHNDLPNLNMNEQTWAASVKRHTDLMDDHNIDAQLIGPRPFLMLGWMQPHLLPGWTRFVNNMIHKQCLIRPDRFAGACQLPQNPSAEDTTHCVAEIDRCVKELGFQGIYLSPDPAGDRSSPGVDTRYWDPIYAKAVEYNIPIIVHGTNCTDPRLAPIPQNYQVGFLWEQFLATQLYMHGEAFERFPTLKVLVCHCGGSLDRFIKSDHHLGQKDYSKNLFFDTNALDLDYLEAAIKQRTPKQTAFGTETPGSGGAIRPETGRPGDDLVPHIGAMPFLSEEDKTLIFEKNSEYLCPALGKLTGRAGVNN
jgi:predicted TIM-barrel fold metal-dependent hydrolase